METISVQPLNLSLSPIEAARRLSHLPGFVYLDSANADGATQHLSILGAQPRALHAGNLKQDAGRLREIIDRHQVTSMDWGFPLGGLFGHVSYEGDFLFGEYEALLIYHHHQDQWFGVGHPAYLNHLDHEPAPSPDPRFGSEAPFAFESGMNRESFIDRVTRAQEWIAAGDIYQVNLTHQFRSPRLPIHDPFANLRSTADHLTRPLQRLPPSGKPADPLVLAGVLPQDERAGHHHAPYQRHTPALH